VSELVVLDVDEIGDNGSALADILIDVELHHP
jgi:hypothetical protein